MSGPHDAVIASMYRSGTTDTKAISIEVGLSTRSVCRALVREQVRDLRTPREHPDLDQRMIDMLVDGASYADVAETFGVAVKWLRESAPGYGWDGQTSGSIAHALRHPEVRRIFHEIRAMPLDEAIRVTSTMPVRNGDHHEHAIRGN